MADLGPGLVPSPWLYGAGLSLSYGAGGIVLGSPSGGAKGIGTINVAGGFYVNGAALPGAFGSQTQNTVYAAPNGSAGAPGFRAIANGDLPASLSLAGTLGVSGQTSVVNLAATGVISGAGFTNYFAAPPPIGATPNTASFTTLGASLASTIAGVALNPSISPPSSFSTPSHPGILLTGGQPLYIAGAPTTAVQDTPAGTLYVTKNTNYTGVPTGTLPAIFGFNDVAAGAQGPQAGVLGSIYNSNTLTSQPSGTSGAIGIYGTGTCGVAGGTATWGGVISAYDVSGQANPPYPLIGLEVDNYANGTDSSGNRVGIQISAGTPFGTGTVNTVTHGILFGGAGGTGGGKFTNLIDGSTSHTLNGVVLSDMVFGAGGIAFNSPGFQIDALGNSIVNSLTTGASISSGASMNIPQGVAPLTPNNGDIWMTSSGLFYRFNSTTHGPL